jgi:ABC-type polar amino acid transport system ATPase subunit
LAALLSQAFALPKLVLMFVGPSSQGKTTLLRVGQSLINSGKNIETLAGTTKEGLQNPIRQPGTA